MVTGWSHSHMRYLNFRIKELWFEAALHMVFLCLWVYSDFWLVHSAGTFLFPFFFLAKIEYIRNIRDTLAVGSALIRQRGLVFDTYLCWPPVIVLPIHVMRSFALAVYNRASLRLRAKGFWAGQEVPWVIYIYFLWELLWSHCEHFLRGSIVEPIWAHSKYQVWPQSSIQGPSLNISWVSMYPIQVLKQHNKQRSTEERKRL